MIRQLPFLCLFGVCLAASTNVTSPSDRAGAGLLGLVTTLADFITSSVDAIVKRQIEEEENPCVDGIVENLRSLVNGADIIDPSSVDMILFGFRKMLTALS